MDVTLAPDLARLVRRQLDSGRYASIDEVFRDALLQMERRDALDDAWRARVGERITAGLTEIRDGKGVDGEAVLDRLDSELAREKTGQPT